MILRISLFVLLISGSIYNPLYAQTLNKKLIESDRNYYVFGGVGFGYTSYRMVDENRLYRKIETTGKLEESSNPSSGLNGHIVGGLLIKEPFIRISGSYHWDSFYSDDKSGSIIKFLFIPIYLLLPQEIESAYSMEHDIQFISIKIDKLFWPEENTKLAYLGVGVSYSFLTDIRSETIRIGSKGEDNKLRDQIEYQASLLSAEMIIGSFTGNNDPWWMELRIGYQHSLDQSLNENTIGPGREVGNKFNPYYSSIYIRFGLGFFI